MFRGQSQLGTCIGGTGGLCSYKTFCWFERMEKILVLDNKETEQDEVEQKKN